MGIFHNSRLNFCIFRAAKTGFNKAFLGKMGSTLGQQNALVSHTNASWKMSIKPSF
jgi:hypothetical protein